MDLSTHMTEEYPALLSEVNWIKTGLKQNESGYLLVPKEDSQGDYLIVRVTKRAVYGEKPVNPVVGALAGLFAGTVAASAGATVGAALSPAAGVVAGPAVYHLIKRGITPGLNSLSDWITGEQHGPKECSPYAVDVIGEIGSNLAKEVATGFLLPEEVAPLAKNAVKLLAGFAGQSAAQSAAEKTYKAAMNILSPEEAPPPEKRRIQPLAACDFSVDPLFLTEAW